MTNQNYRYHPLDLANHDAIDALVESAKPDIVIHTAWEGVAGAARADDIQFANIASICRLVDATIRCGAGKFVGIGSQAEYGRFDRPLVESDLPHPSTLYGAAKLSACHLARQRAGQAGIGFAWLRLFATYGPGDNPNWLIPSLIAAMAAGRRPRTTPGTQKWDYLFNEDTAQGILAAALEPEAEGIFNLSSGRAVAVRDIVEALRDLVAPGMELVFGEVPFGPAQIMHLEGDIARLSAATGWAPRVPLAEGLARTVDAMRVAA